MALTHATATRNALADQITAKVDTGTGTATLKIKDGGGTVLVTLNLPNPSFGAASNGVITLNGVPITANATAGGTAATFELYARDGSLVLSGSVGTSGADMTVDNTNIANGQEFKLNSMTWTAPT